MNFRIPVVIPVKGRGFVDQGLHYGCFFLVGASDTITTMMVIHLYFAS